MAPSSSSSTPPSAPIVVPAPAHVYSVEPSLPSAHYSSFFELLEATPPSDPFQAVLADFIRAPEDQKPRALRALWDQALLARPPMPLEKENEENEGEACERERVLKEERDHSYDEGFIAGQNTAKKVTEEEFVRRYQKGRLNGYREGLQATPEGVRKSDEEAVTQWWYHKGLDDAKFDCEDGICPGVEVGMLKERASGLRLSHQSTGHCKAMPTSTVDMGTSTDTEDSPSTVTLNPQESRQFCDVATSMDQTPLPPPLSELPPTSLNPSNWGDDISTIPLVPMFPCRNSQLPRRDISVLRSGVKRPFDSLRRRSHRFPHNASFIQAPVFTHSHIPPAPNYATKPALQLPSPRPCPDDWSANPQQLVKLAQVLQILGWFPPR
ncbi:hypothetical protein BDZ89DRAFT_1045747 [Hymenopellis radicata]|nr:hypothetical protein BDZ89DRAFT_1045747 [Hymenopellis radicata]